MALRIRVFAAALALVLLFAVGGVPAAHAGLHLTSRSARAQAAFHQLDLPRGSVYIEARGDLLNVVIADVGDAPSLRLEPGWEETLRNLASRHGAPAAGKPSVVLNVATAQRFDNDMARILREFDVWAFDAVHVPFRVRTFPAGTMLELTPSLHMPLGRTPIPLDLPWVLGRSLAPARIRIVAAFGADHADAVQRLAQAGGPQRTSTIDRILDETGAVSLRGHDGNILMIVGHVEKNSFVIRRADGSISQVLPLDRITEEAARRKVSVIYLGCDSYPASAYNGLVAQTSDIGVSQKIESALREKTLGGFLSRLGTPEEPFVVTRESLTANKAVIDFALTRVLKKSAAVAGGVTVVRVAASRWIEHPAPAEEPRTTPIP